MGIYVSSPLLERSNWHHFWEHWLIGRLWVLMPSALAPGGWYLEQPVFEAFPRGCCKLLGSLGVCLLASPLPLQLIFLRSPLRHTHPSYSVFFFLLQTNPQLSFGMQSYNSQKGEKYTFFFFYQNCGWIVSPVSGEGWCITSDISGL